MIYYVCECLCCGTQYDRLDFNECPECGSTEFTYPAGINYDIEDNEKE